MTEVVDCDTQADLEAAVKNGNMAIVRSGIFSAYGLATVSAYDLATVSAYGSATVSAYDSATVHAYGLATVSAYGSATVSAYGSATVSAYDSATVHAYGSATVSAYDLATVSAYGSATVSASDSATVRAYGSAIVSAYGSAIVSAYDSATVSAYGSAIVSAYDLATVSATPFVAVQRISKLAKVNGGVIIQIPEIKTTADFLAYYGIKTTRGTVTLYKLVDDNYVSAHNTSYKPGEKPTASDWDPKPCCGYGLHFSPQAFLARKYAAPTKERFVACKVRVKDIVVIDDCGQPDKVKASSCTVLHECDEDGVELQAERGT